MLVSELRKEIEKYNKKNLENIIVELYKRLPKSQKEDYNIDDFIKNVNLSKTSVKKKQSFDDLQKEIRYFLQCVDMGFYVSPNKVISKKERSSWRFKVKKYYKELNNIPPLSNNGEEATILLIEIFKRLSIGSNRLLFINWETFRALGVSQRDYYDMLIHRIMSSGYVEKNIQKCFDLLNVPKDPYELSFDMFWVFISNLKTVDNKKTAMQMAEDKVKELQIKLKSTQDSSIQFSIKEDINDYTICITNIYFLLPDIELGIKYFHKNYIETTKEVKEYVLLKELEYFELYEYWIDEYESKQKSINFRDSLKEKYNEFKKKI